MKQTGAQSHLNVATMIEQELDEVWRPGQNSITKRAPTVFWITRIDDAWPFLLRSGSKEVDEERSSCGPPSLAAEAGLSTDCLQKWCWLSGRIKWKYSVSPVQILGCIRQKLSIFEAILELANQVRRILNGPLRICRTKINRSKTQDIRPVEQEWVDDVSSQPSQVLRRLGDACVAGSRLMMADSFGRLVERRTGVCMRCHEM